MALDWMCGFEGMASADLALGVFSTNISGSVLTTSPRTGSRYLSFSTPAASSVKTGLSNAATRIAGFGIRTPNNGVGGSVFFAFSDGSPTTAANVQVGIQYNADGSFSAYRGRALGGSTGGTLLGSSATGALPSSDVWYFLEVIATIDPSAGVVEVWLENTRILNLTSQNTRATANSYANAFGFSDASSSTSWLYDDIYILSGTGGVRTSRFGNFKCVGVVASSGDGSLGQFTPSSGSDNGAMVDETTPNSDTDYNESTGVGNIDTYNFANLGVVGSVVGLQVKNYTKAQAGSVTVRAVQRISGTNYFNTAQSIASSYAYGPLVISEQSPASATDYTVSEIDGAEFGIEHNA